MPGLKRGMTPENVITDKREGRNAIFAAALLALLALLTAALPACALDFPALSGRVVDDANILDNNATRRAHRRSLPISKPSPPTSWSWSRSNRCRAPRSRISATSSAAHWGIGQKGKNNGVLLIVAPNERKVRIEVGYGLEGTLTDAVTRLLSRTRCAALPRQ